MYGSVDVQHAQSSTHSRVCKQVAATLGVFCALYLLSFALLGRSGQVLPPLSFSSPSPGRILTHQQFDTTLDVDFDRHSAKIVTQISKQVYPGYPECQSRVQWLSKHWDETAETRAYYGKAGVNGSITSYLDYLNQNGLYCPTAADATKNIIRGVAFGGWFVFEPWIVPSLFEQFDPALGIRDHWGFCQTLGKVECMRQSEKHWDTWVTEDDIRTLAEAGINHARIPVGYWIMGDIRPGEPWVYGGLPYLQRAMLWFKKYDIRVMFDLHCAPGSQNGFDNSGKVGPIHWADSATMVPDVIIYPNMDRTLTVLEGLVSVFSLDPFNGVVTYVELVNEAFLTIPIHILKDFYLRGYAAVRNINPNIGIVIGDSFRMGEWNQFMYPPAYTHVYIDTHIYQVFDRYLIGLDWEAHYDLTCLSHLPMVAIAPLSCIVGEWALAVTDCAPHLNGYFNGARYDAKFRGWQESNIPVGSCVGQNDPRNKTVWTREYKAHLKKFAELQMDAYEAGSSRGWFFWNFKTERAPQWDYLAGLRGGWIPKDPSIREHTCLDRVRRKASP